VEVAPEVPLGRYKGLKLVRPKRQAFEEQMDRVLDHLRQSHAELKPIPEDRAAVAGDFLLADLTEHPPGKQPESHREVVIHLDLEKDPEGPFKDLLGMKPSETRTLTLKGGGTLAVHLKALKVREVPALDGAFARSVGTYESLEALKEAVRKDLQRQAEDAQREALETQALRQLVEGWTFEVPPSLVASQARRILKERPADQAQVSSEQAKLDALNQVKLFFILQRIAGAEGLSVSEQEVGGRIKELAERMRMPLEELRKDWESKELLEDLAWRILRGKVLDLILREASIQHEERVS